MGKGSNDGTGGGSQQHMGSGAGQGKWSLFLCGVNAGTPNFPPEQAVQEGALRVSGAAPWGECSSVWGGDPQQWPEVSVLSPQEIAIISVERSKVLGRGHRGQLKRIITQ